MSQDTVKVVAIEFKDSNGKIFYKTANIFIKIKNIFSLNPRVLDWWENMSIDSRWVTLDLNPNIKFKSPKLDYDKEEIKLKETKTTNYSYRFEITPLEKQNHAETLIFVTIEYPGKIIRKSIKCIFSAKRSVAPVISFFDHEKAR